MELALYCPKLGYYERSTALIGRAGDFITSVNVGRVFGELLAFQFAGWLEAVSGPVQLVEAGAHDGRLAHDVMGHLRSCRSELYARLELWLIEPSPLRRAAQAATLADHSSKTRWFADWGEIAPRAVRGVIYSNELLDAFPVRRYGWDAGRRRWFEWGVAQAGEGFTWARLEAEETAAAQAALRAGGFELTDELVAVLPDGFTVECNPGALAWWRAAADALGQGWLVAVDYGFEAREFLRPERARGTLRACAGHRFMDDPLADPGEQDLTAHVNFTAIRAAGEAAGLVTDRFESQEEFLTRVFRHTEKRDRPFGKWTPGRLRQFQTLVHPAHFGRPFRVLVQAR